VFLSWNEEISQCLLQTNSTSLLHKHPYLHWLTCCHVPQMKSHLIWTQSCLFTTL
jgi:hypothetical protein